ncbi:MAG: hypothetical protein M1140_02330 [Chloroflexi bacterium]|nr:hypothetical protein [Chloroflexota bacterium]
MTNHTQPPTAEIRTVLEGVPRVAFYEGGKRCPEDIIFPSVLRAWLEYMDDKDFGCKHCMARAPECKVNCTYAFLIGVTGVASFLSWGKGWQGDNVAIHYMSSDPDAPFRRAFEATGYAYEWVTKEPGRDNGALFRARVVQSVREGRPVLGFGVIGPPEPSLINGYDDAGGAVLGWSFFQNFPDFNTGVEFEPSGYFRKRDWVKDTLCLAVLGARKERPDFGKVVRESLQWMVQMAGTPQAYSERANGLAAYEAWAADIQRDDQFPAHDETTLRAHHMVHNDAVGTVAEARWYGGLFLQEAIDFVHYNMAEDLLHAAACYAGEHELMWKAWDLAGGNGNPQAHRAMVDPAVRRQMAEVILQSRDKSAKAIEYIEHALAK